MTQEQKLKNKIDELIREFNKLDKRIARIEQHLHIHDCDLDAEGRCKICGEVL